MNKSNMLLKIEARTTTYLGRIKCNSPAVLNDLLMSPAEVQDELNKIDLLAFNYYRV